MRALDPEEVEAVRAARSGLPFELSERHAAEASSTNTDEPHDQPRHDIGHPQAEKQALTDIITTCSSWTLGNRPS